MPSSMPVLGRAAAPTGRRAAGGTDRRRRSGGLDGRVVAVRRRRYLLDVDTPLDCSILVTMPLVGSKNLAW